MSRRRFPAVPLPLPTVQGVHDAVQALKEGYEVLSSQKRGSQANAAVTWQDLLDLGLIEEHQIPRGPR